MALTREEREAFLAEPRTASVGVAGEGGRGPLVVPIWFGYEPGGLPWILTGTDSVKGRLIRSAGRFSLLVERTSPTTRYVSVEGPVAEITEGTPAHHRELAARYLSGEPLDRYVQMAVTQMSDHVVIRMRPAHWHTADLGSWT